MRRPRDVFVLDPAGAAAVAAHVQELRRRELGPATLWMCRETVRRFAGFVHPLALLDAGRVDVERWVDDMLERGRRGGIRATYTGRLREFFRWAIRRGLVEADPTVEVASPRVVAGCRIRFPGPTWGSTRQTPPPKLAPTAARGVATASSATRLNAVRASTCALWTPSPWYRDGRSGFRNGWCPPRRAVRCPG